MGLRAGRRRSAKVRFGHFRRFAAIDDESASRPNSRHSGGHRFGPIVLKKSVDGVDQIFSASWKRFPNKNVEGRMAERRRDVGRSKSNYEANKSRL
jgi:hypothetical protein